VRLVLDTNVAVSALISGGTPYKLLQAATDGNSELLLAESHGVLAREHLASRLAQPLSSVDLTLGVHGLLRGIGFQRLAADYAERCSA